MALSHCPQSGDLASFPWLGVLPLALIFFASNIITALPDVGSDLEGGKRSYPVRHGLATAASHALVLSTVACVMLIAIDGLWLGGGWYGLAVVGPAFGLLLYASRLRFSGQMGGMERPVLQRFMALTLSSHAWVLLAGTVLLFWRGAQSG